MSQIKVSASLLAADFARLGEEIKAVEPYVDMIHLDVMDGHFVPNLSFGAPVIEKLRSWTSLPFDVHLMIAPVDPLLKDFAKAGANLITVHPESGPHIYRTLQEIKDLGCEAGVCLNPGTPVEILRPLLPIVDLVLVMTVNPGFGGQAFLESGLQKIMEVRSIIKDSGRKIRISVDGGITPQTAPRVLEAGSDILVAGTSIFNGNPQEYKARIQSLKGV